MHKEIENRVCSSLQELQWYIYMHSGRGFLLEKRQKRMFLEQVSMCRQAAYLIKQTNWGRNPYIVASCTMQFSFLTSCILKFGKPLCYHLISLWRSSKYYHQHTSLGCGPHAVHGSRWPNAERSWSKQKMFSYIRHSRRCVNTVWATQHLVAEAIFLYWCE